MLGLKHEFERLVKTKQFLILNPAHTNTGTGESQTRLACRFEARAWVLSLPGVEKFHPLFHRPQLAPSPNAPCCWFRTKAVPIIWALCLPSPSLTVFSRSSPSPQSVEKGCLAHRGSLTLTILQTNSSRVPASGSPAPGRPYRHSESGRESIAGGSHQGAPGVSYRRPRGWATAASGASERWRGRRGL